MCGLDVLAFLYREATKAGGTGWFNKFVGREPV
mgnify:CR=1 FL=1